MYLIILYHYFIAHGVQYIVHFITHHKNCPLIFSKNHKLHHGNPIKITWYGQSTFNSQQTNTLTDLYYISFIFYLWHIYYFFYDTMLKHFLGFVIIAGTFLVFHGMCHYLPLEKQKQIPIINVLFYHHYKHHLNTSINIGFGDIIYDFLFGTLDLSRIDRNNQEYMKNKERIDKKYFIT